MRRLFAELGDDGMGTPMRSKQLPFFFPDNITPLIHSKVEVRKWLIEIIGTFMCLSLGPPLVFLFLFLCCFRAEDAFAGSAHRNPPQRYEQRFTPPRNAVR